MKETPIVRESRIIQEEINDLQKYLNGIPDSLKETGAFDSYERRMLELNRELLLSQLYSLYLPSEKLLNDELSNASNYNKVYSAVEERLRSLQGQHNKSANRYTRIKQILEYSLLAGTGCLVIASLLPASSVFFTTFSVISAALALVQASSRSVDRVRQEERLANYYKILLSETENLLLQAESFPEKSRYYENSAKTIQELVEQIRLQEKEAE